MTEEIKLELKVIVLYNLFFIQILSPHMIKTDESIVYEVIIHGSLTTH